MKNSITFLAIFMLTFFSCTEKNKYEQLVSDYVQTDSHGIKTDIQLQVLEIKELPPVTVKDSVEILKADFEKKKKDQIESAGNLLRMSHQTLEKEQKSSIPLQTIIDLSKKNITKAQSTIDSLTALQFVDVYAGESQGKVLSQPVQCRYSFVFPKNNPRQEIEEIFYVTPGITKIADRKRVKN